MNHQVIIQNLSTGAMPYMQQVDNCIEWLQTYLTDVSRVLVVRGGASYSACGAENVIKQLQSALKAEYTFFSDFSTNPKYEEAITGAKLCSDILPNVIIAIGGGSVIDTAKLMRHYAHDSVGGQPTVGLSIDLPKIAEAVGYKTVLKASVETELRTALSKLDECEKTALVEICVRKGNRKDLSRPTTTPIQNKEAFMQNLSK